MQGWVARRTATGMRMYVYCRLLSCSPPGDRKKRRKQALHAECRDVRGAVEEGRQEVRAAVR